MSKEISKGNVNKSQRENAYILYMMIGSYFRRCHCVSCGVEQNLYLYYQEMPMNRQTKAEEQVLRRFNRKFEEFSHCLEDLECKVHIRYVKDNYIIYFATGFEEIIVTVYPNGQYKIVGYGKKAAGEAA